MTKEEVKNAVTAALVKHVNTLNIENEAVVQSVLSELFPTPLQKLERHLNHGTLKREETVKLRTLAKHVAEIISYWNRTGFFTVSDFAHFFETLFPEAP